MHALEGKSRSGPLRACDFQSRADWQEIVEKGKKTWLIRATKHFGAMTVAGILKIKQFLPALQSLRRAQRKTHQLALNTPL